MTSKNKDVINEDLEMLNTKMRLKFLNNYMSLTYHLITNKYYRNIFYMRIGFISKIFSWILPPCNSFFPCGNIGGGVYPAHPFATIINADSIGRNLTIRQCTTIGNKYDGSDERPIIGDNVNIGSNVVIIGKVKIGSNVTIGAGTVITKDVPDNSLVVGNPFRIFQNK